MNKAEPFRSRAIALLIATCVTCVFLLCSPANAIGPVQPTISSNNPTAVYDAWNKCVESLQREGDFETGLWPTLQDSIKKDPPEHLSSLDRQTIIDELIEEHQARIDQLRRMRKADR